MTQWPVSNSRRGFEALAGLSVAGLVIASVQSFGLVWPAAAVPTLAPGFEAGLNAFAWWLTETLFAPVFAILLCFALGAWLAALDEAPSPAGPQHWGYLGWLMLIGLVHAYLVWFGDLLVPFAVMGLITAAGARLRLWTQIGLGGGLVVFTLLVLLGATALGGLFGSEMPAATALGFPPERVAEINAAYQRGFLARLPANMSFALMNQLMLIVFLGAGLSGVMLLGMAALRAGFFDLRWPAMQYGLSGAVAIGIGGPLCGWANLVAMQSGFALDEMVPASAAGLIGAPLLAYGFAALLMLACQTPALERGLAVLERFGQVWLSAYLLASLVLVLVFSGLPGLSLFGRVPHGGLLLIALVLDAALVTGAWFWTERFRLGPAEWLWAVLVTRKRQVLRRRMITPS